MTERHIQDLIAEQMVSLGFKQAPDPDQADVAIVYSYSIGAGRTTSRPDFVWGGQAVSTAFPRYFQVSLVDIKRSLDQKKAIIIWQAEIYSEGSSRNMNWLVEHLIPELFKRFGQTTTNELFVTAAMAPIF